MGTIGFSGDWHRGWKHKTIYAAVMTGVKHYHAKEWASIGSRLREYYAALREVAISERLEGVIRRIKADEKNVGVVAKDAQDIL